MLIRFAGPGFLEHDGDSALMVGSDDDAAELIEAPVIVRSGDDLSPFRRGRAGNVVSDDGEPAFDGQHPLFGEASPGFVFLDIFVRVIEPDAGTGIRNLGQNLIEAFPIGLVGIKAESPGFSHFLIPSTAIDSTSAFSSPALRQCCSTFRSSEKEDI